MGENAMRKIGYFATLGILVLLLGMEAQEAFDQALQLNRDLAQTEGYLDIADKLKEVAHQQP